MRLDVGFHRLPQRLTIERQHDLVARGLLEHALEIGPLPGDCDGVRFGAFAVGEPLDVEHELDRLTLTGEHLFELASRE
jgi:hypothetical protein